MVDIKALQNCELEMLVAFIEVCNKLGLNYYLLGGTLLGAARHEGFIPWDDDIDVGMKRQDYNVFVNSGQAFLPEYYFIQTHHTDPQWPTNFAKIRDSRTTFIESSVKNQKINHGVYIDIFPLDCYTSDIAVQRRFDRKNKQLLRRINSVLTVQNHSPKRSILREIARTSLCALSYIQYPTLQSALDKRERLFKSITSGNMIANHCGAWGKKEIIPSQWYSEGTNLSFEGLSVSCPLQYDKWLTQVYGDYMQLPPIEKRVAHHFCEVIDLDTPYTEYVKKENNT